YFLWIQRSLRIVTHSLVFAGLHATLVTNTISRSSWSSSLIFRFGNTSKKSFSILFSFLLFVPVKKFFSQRIKKLILRHLLHNLALLDQKTHAVAACNADIRFFRFSRTVHHTSHDGHLDIQRDILNHGFHSVRKADKIDPGTAAGGTGNNFHPSFAQSQSLQYSFCGFDLLQRRAGKRDAYGISDPLIKDDAQAHSGFDISGIKGSRFCDP